MTIATAAYQYYEQIGSTARDELQGLRTMAAAIPRTPLLPASSGGPELPAFDSAAFTAEFHQVANDAGLPIDELAYVLESGIAQPYQRYRITMDVKAGYPELRKFIAASNAAQPNVTLDSVRCRRDDAATAPLICQLAFSAFFRKATHA